MLLPPLQKLFYWLIFFNKFGIHETAQIDRLEDNGQITAQNSGKQNYLSFQKGSGGILVLIHRETFHPCAQHDARQCSHIFPGSF